MNDGVINDSFGLANVNEVLASFGACIKVRSLSVRGKDGKTRENEDEESTRARVEEGKRRERKSCTHDV